MSTLLIFLVVLSTQIYAAVDGVLGLSSTGNLNISISKGNLVRISNLQDINFGAHTVAPSEQFIDFCVFSSTQSYSLTASSANPNGANFRLTSSDSADFIVYDVFINDLAAGLIADGNNLNHGTPSPNLSNASSTALDCNGGNNARLFIQIDGTSFTNASSDFYTDNLELLVSPL